MKTSELVGKALDWAVAKAVGGIWEDGSMPCWPIWPDSVYCRPSESWEQGGPIIEREGLCLAYDPFVKRWRCYTPVLDSQMAETPLVAAMRCYVASCFGDEVEIPEELCTTLKTSKT